MRIAYLLLIFVHALIHLLGFVKGFGLKEIRELSLPVSKSFGLFWLLSALLFILYAVCIFFNSRYSWVVGMLAVLVSQVLILFYWRDARFGTIPNGIVFMVTLVFWAYANFQQSVEQETKKMLSKNEGYPVSVLQEDDLSQLPQPVKRWIRSSGALGQKIPAFAKIEQRAELQMKPDHDHWMSASAVQYTTLNRPGFIWSVDVRMNPVLNFQGRDKFEDGKGEMLIKLNSLITVVDEKGAKIDEGSLQRFLGEMVWFPSMALSPYVSWESIDDTTAKAKMVYNGTAGDGVFGFNESGDVIRFSALRYKGNDPGSKRYMWEMNISEYRSFEGIRVPSKMTSTWKLENGDWTWLNLEVTSIRYNPTEEE